MSKSPRNPKAGLDPSADLPYEDAVKKLEALVEEMESGDLVLETLIARFEEGSRLARHCQAKLAQAELKIQQLERNAEGEVDAKPFDSPPATTP